MLWRWTRVWVSVTLNGGHGEVSRALAGYAEQTLIAHLEAALGMGHQRLGEIPKSRKWSAVAAAVGHRVFRQPDASSQDVEEVADRTLDAAEAGLARCFDDPGLRYTFFLLTQIASGRPRRGLEGASRSIRNPCFRGLVAL